MPTHLTALSATLALSCLAFAAPTAMLHVAPTGNDADPGTQAKPFATLERARDEIRKLKQAGKLPTGGVTVELRGGIYERGKTFELKKEDSGTADTPIVYSATEGETPRLIAGRVVKGFKPVTDPAVLGMLAPEARGKVMQADLKAQGITDYGNVGGGGMELFFRDEPMTVSRWPNKGFTRIVKMVGEPYKRDRHMTHKVGKWVYDGDRPERWAKEKDVWVHGYWFHDWSDQRHRVKQIDTDARTIEVQPPYHGYGYRKGKWYYAFNLLSEIDTPGEWHLDRDTGVLYFWPPAPIRDRDCIVSVVPTLATMTDVSHVTIQGLFMEAARGTGLAIRGGEGNRVVGCTFRNLGGRAVTVGGGTQHGVVGCDVYNTGQGGIALNGGDRKTLTPAGHFAENNHVHHYARIKRVYQPGVTLHGVGCRASHNLIHNAPHMGMGFGGNDHVIELNEIHSVCYESNDAGAIYTGRNWTMRGHVIRHNYLHHISGFEGRGCVGVYLDDSFSSADIIGNVFYNVTRAAMIGGGRDCRIENNIFVDCVPAVHVDARAVGWASRYAKPGGGWRMQEKLAALPYQKPPWTKYPHLANILDDEPCLPKYNTVARNIFVRGTWNGIRPKARPHVTVEDNLIDQDPRFVDAAEGNFQLRDDSPAYRIGFKRIPVEKIGLYDDERRASWPVTHEVRPMPKPPARRAKAKRGPAPVCKVPKREAEITIDGTLSPVEWNGLDTKKALVIGDGIRGEKVEPKSYAWLAYDDQYLYVGILNKVDPKRPLQTESTWGENDAVEIAIRNPVGKATPILVLRGYPKSQFESSTEAGAPFEVAQDANAATTYAAKIVSKSEWSCEWRIAWPGLRIDPAKHTRFPFNLSARKTAGRQWMMWRGTMGYTWKVEEAGVIELSK